MIGFSTSTSMMWSLGLLKSASKLTLRSSSSIIKSCLSYRISMRQSQMQIVWKQKQNLLKICSQWRPWPIDTMSRWLNGCRRVTTWCLKAMKTSLTIYKTKFKTRNRRSSLTRSFNSSKGPRTGGTRATKRASIAECSSQCRSSWPKWRHSEKGWRRSEWWERRNRMTESRSPMKFKLWTCLRKKS